MFSTAPRATGVGRRVVMMATTTCKGRYCCVYGCLNSTLNKPDLSFFQLPSDIERRNEWLRLICREDLTDKNYTSYKVCEEHFNEQDISVSQRNKRLVTKAIPIINLPSLARVDAGTQTIDGNTAPRSQTVQTDKIYPINKNTQTAQFLLLDTPLVKKFKSEISECKKQARLNEICDRSKQVQTATLRKLSDKFLSKNLAMIVKANADLESHSHGNRYDRKYIEFCLNLYDTSPSAYNFLQSVFRFPSSATLHTLKSKTQDDFEATISTNTSNFDGPTNADASLDDFDATTPVKTENLNDIRTTHYTTTSNVKYSDASTSTTTDKLLLATKPSNTNKNLEATTSTDKSPTSPEAFSFLRSALCATKTKTEEENNLETTTSSITNNLEATNSTHRKNLEAETSSNTNNFAMIICDIPPNSPSEYYDPLQM